MKTKLVDTITSNEDHVRMRIFDGDLQINEAAQELIRLERSQRDYERFLYRQTIDELYQQLIALTGGSDVS